LGCRGHRGGRAAGGAKVAHRGRPGCRPKIVWRGEAAGNGGCSCRLRMCLWIDWLGGFSSGLDVGRPAAYIDSIDRSTGFPILVGGDSETCSDTTIL
jgi:hypothetical protein